MSSGAPTEVGTPIRYPSTALLCVDSEDGQRYSKDGFRIDQNIPSDIYINKGRPMMFGYMTRVALTEVNMEWTTPNVFRDAKTGYSNNTLTLAMWDKAEDALLGYTRISIEEKFYTLPEITKALEAALNAQISEFGGFAGLVWYVRWNTQEGMAAPKFNDFSISIELRTEEPVAFQIVSGRVPRAADAPLPALPAVQDDLTYMLGLTPVAPGAVAYYNIVKSGYASMAYTPYVDIVSNLLTKNQNVSDNDSTLQGRTALLARLYLSNSEIQQRVVTAVYGNAPLGGDEQSGPLLSSTDNAVGVRPFVFHREFATPKQIQWNTTENIDVMDLRVLDRLGKVLYITPTAFVEDGGAGDYFMTFGNTSDFQFTVQTTEI